MTPLDPIPVETSPAAPTQEERTAALLVWLVNILLHVIGPLIVWWVMGKGSGYVWHHARACINHTLTILVLVLIACVVLGGIVWGGMFLFDDTSMTLLITVIVVLVLLLLVILGLALTSLIIHLIAALKGNAGVWWTPPLCWRFMR